MYFIGKKKKTNFVIWFKYTVCITQKTIVFYYSHFNTKIISGMKKVGCKYLRFVFSQIFMPGKTNELVGFKLIFFVKT